MFSLLSVAENDENVLEEVDEVQVDSQALIDRIVHSLGFGMINDFLNIKQCEGAEQDNSTIEPNVEESSAGPENTEQVNTDHSCQGHAKHALPLQELFTRCIVSNQTETSHGETCGKESIEDHWHGIHVNQGNH